MAPRAVVFAVFLLAELLSGFQAYQKLFVSGENVEVGEDVSVGSTVVRLIDFLNASDIISSEADNNGTFWSVNITAGDDTGRFGVRAEDLALVVAAPLDYRVHQGYNLTVELTNTGDKNVLYVTLVIVVLDVPECPPLYNKRCETPVLPDRGRGGGYTVLSGIEDPQHLKPRNTTASFVLNGDCSGRFAFSVLRQSDNAWKFALLQGPLMCYDRRLREKGKITLFDLSLDGGLPQWVRSGFQTEESGYVIAVELDEIWSTSPYWVRCGGNFTVDSGTLGLPQRLVYSIWNTIQYHVTGCPEGLYGVYCDKHCVCKNGARCHGFNGACECRLGWRGRACDIPCPEAVIVETPGDSVVKYISTRLTLTCVAPHIHVANMTWVDKAGKRHNDKKVIEKGTVQRSSISFEPILESDNGRYSCFVQAEDGKRFNASFILNATECRPNYHGEDCSQVCDCQYGGTCDRWKGCLCPPGRHGDRCEHTCAPGTFGLNCSTKCDCDNHASCDPTNGTCCTDGQSGESCQTGSVPDNVVVAVLASVIPIVAVIGCIVTGVLEDRPRRPAGTNVGSELTSDMTSDMTSVIATLSSWEVDKEDIRFEHMIGEGEFGHVVRGRLRVPAGYQVLVAAKCLRSDRATASAARDFRREMTILTRIHEDREGHPNVVKLFGVVTKSEPQYILVEYASREDLRRYLWTLREHYKTTGNSKLLERLGFACDVACGLSELARLKIVHRDIAARNVVISDRKAAKISDFGLSRDVYVSSAYKRTDQGGEEELLPLKWMSVESLRDGVYTCESDVWSYGVLLWEIASFGEEPRYAGGPMHPDVCTLLELLRKGVRLQQPENCPLSVYRIIRSCWIVDPSKRPTPEELFQRIDQMRPERYAARLVNHNSQ
ncbi:uncharacterized protein LOC144877142 [Branchiostoma floridae x Branchiostoma japonicum]